MNRSLGNVMADSLEQCLRYAERLLNDVKPEQFARFAVVNGKVIESNHPAFVYEIGRASCRERVSPRV